MKLHYFNPGHETAVSNASPYYTAPANVVAMQHELAFLPAWYADSADRILTDDSTDEYYTYLCEKLPSLPKPISADELGRLGNAEVSLWGISPQVIYHFETLNKDLELKLKIPEWHREYTYLNGRQAARDCLMKLATSIPELSQAIIPKFYTKLEDIYEAVNNSPCQLLAKAPYSSSGRGLLWLPVTGLTRTENQILHGILKKQGSISVEKVLDKYTDFALEFMADGKGGIEFAGYSLFHTNPKGGYESNHIGSQEDIEAQLSEKVGLSLIHRIKESLIAILSATYAAYTGCIGVDMLVYKENGEYKLHPCLEINMRYNMGFLTCRLYQNYISPGSSGKFYLDFNSVTGEMYKNHLRMQYDYPPRFEKGKLLSGYLPLCPVNEESKYRAYILIDKDSLQSFRT
ncbi:hypothetical protein D0T84_15435 [Dysgonomonas sp. 521]|uniref:hypothetical protein n=1 Tax=Dysgonomonas sp. 521 TaxID=2302932 RepID=UPI0013D1831B|nr:hypothetical protein [Dysgonomonas sp. 521]NDV96294.1 hypothetical protein [Dysgonomonas sp. 521]